MKKNFVIKGACALVALVMVSCVSVGFGNNVKVNASNVSSATKAWWKKNKTVITDNKNIQEYEVKKTGAYEISCVPSDGNAYWDVYVLDEQFEEGFRYIPQAYRPKMKAINKAQIIELKKGQYVYVHCSVNALTADLETLETFECPLTIEFKGRTNKTVITENMNMQEYPVTKTGTYELSCVPSDGNAYWDVYVLDEQFMEGFRYITTAYKPVMKVTSEPQQIELKKGQFVYVNCSVNEFAFDEATIDNFTCPLTIEYKKR